MNIKFKTLKLHNFMSFGDSEVNLDDSGYTLVSGENNCKLDLAKSNGSGKSSLWEGIVWVLTGDTIRGTKDVINRYGKDGTYVEIVFYIDNTKYKVIRYKEYAKIGTNLKVYIDDIDKSGKGIRDTESLLAQYLPELTSDLIGSVIILGQGLPQRFTNNTPSGRKEVLEKLSKSDFMIDDIKNKLSNRKMFLNQELRKYEDLVLSAESKKNMVDNNIVKTKEQLNNIPVRDFDNEIVDAEMNYSYLKSCINENEYLSITNKLNECRTEYKTFDLNCKNELNEVDARYSESIKFIQTHLTEAKVKVAYIKDEINRLENIKDICPTCGQKLPHIHKVDTTDLYNEWSSWNTKLSDAEADLAKTEEDKAKDKFNITNKQQEKRVELENNGKILREQFDIIEKAYNKQKQDAENARLELEKVKSDKEMYNFKWKELNTSLQALEGQSKQLSEEILYNNIEKDNIKSRVDIVNKMLTIATRDFRGFLLSGIIDFINHKAKEYCKEIFDTEEIEFKLDGNNIFIGYCGKQYENLSGGEKQKIDLIVQFSIRDMLSQYLSFSSNILVLDEICDNLDYIGCQRVMNLISTKLSDISSLFIITHHTDELAIPYDNELMIIKDEYGISKILG